MIRPEAEKGGQKKCGRNIHCFRQAASTRPRRSAPFACAGRGRAGRSHPARQGDRDGAGRAQVRGPVDLERLTGMMTNKLTWVAAGLAIAFSLPAAAAPTASETLAKLGSQNPMTTAYVQGVLDGIDVMRSFIYEIDPTPMRLVNAGEGLHSFCHTKVTPDEMATTSSLYFQIPGPQEGPIGRYRDPQCIDRGLPVPEKRMGKAELPLLKGRSDRRRVELTVR